MKSLVRIAAIADKEWQQIKRDTRSLVLALVAPVLLIILFGYALTVDVKHVKVTVFDQDKSTTSRNFIQEFTHTEYLDIVDYCDDYRIIDKALNDGSSSLALVIPKGFERKLKTKSGGVKIQLLVDGSDSASATVAMGYVKAIVAGYNANIQMKELQRAGISYFEIPVDVRNRIWYNPELQSKNFIIPGLIVIILAIISALIASLTISREWERGTMETLMTTPVRPWELIAGKIIPYLFIGFFDVMVTVSVGYFIFDMPLKGSFVELYLWALLFLTGTTGLGILLSAATRVQVLSVQVAMIVTYLPSFMLSGFIFPIENMPAFLQFLTYLIPAKYLLIIVKGIALKGVGAAMLWSQIVFLLIFTCLILIVCAKKIKLQLDN